MAGNESASVNRHEREALLDRVEREGATVGTRIPERLAVGDETVPLRERVLAFHRTDNPDEDAVHALTVALRRERKARLERLESEPDLDRSGAELVAEEIIGIDRALATLCGVTEDEDIEAAIHRQRVADTERWRHFLKKANADDLDGSVRR